MRRKRPIVVVKLGTTMPHWRAAHGDFDDWIAAGLGVDSTRIRIHDVTRSTALPESNEVAGVVLSGSHSMVTDREPWSERTAHWVKRLAADDVPTLGLCYGHQLIADAFGGRVGPAPNGPEYGTVELTFLQAADDDPLFAGLPRRTSVQTSHDQSVHRLPEGAVVLARSRLDPHQAFRIGRCIWGVQFHPEFDLASMRTYLHEYAEPLSRQGVDVAERMQSAEETPQAAGLLRRFAELIGADS